MPMNEKKNIFWNSTQNDSAFLLKPFMKLKPSKPNCSGVSEKSAEQDIVICFLLEVSIKNVYDDS